MSRLYKITINQPRFEEIYQEFQKKVNSMGQSLDDVIGAIKKQLKNDTEITYPMNFSVEDKIYKPLQEKGFNNVASAVRYLIDAKYFNKSTNMGRIEYTNTGWKWVHGEPNNLLKDSNNNDNDNEVKKINFFSIPPKATNKVKKLLEEINNLPEIKNFENLIAHQLRTILALALLDYWVKESIDIKIKNSLHKLLQYTIDNSKNKNVKEISKSIKEERFKSLSDDINHCNYTLVENKDIINKYCMHIKNLLSQIYGR